MGFAKAGCAAGAVIAGSGHFVGDEQPAEVVAVLRRFMELAVA
jgi:hypothetical protein